MHMQPLDQLEKIIKDAFPSAAKIRKNFQTFIIEVIILHLSISKRINFTQMERFGDSCESRFRQNYNKPFNWVGFNSHFAEHMKGHRKAIALDPSYISKSGHHTPGVGYFWSGCAGSSKWGLEITDIALVDVDEKEAVHLKAVQTVDTIKVGRPPKYLAGVKDPNSLIAWYLRIIADERESLIKLSNLVVADAYFSKAPFVNGLKQLGFNLVSRFRDDVSLKYLYTGPKTGKRGRPKQTDGKVDIDNINKDVFKEEVLSDGNSKTYSVFSAIVWATSLKRTVKVVIADCMEPGKKTQTRKIFFSTDTEMSAKDIVETYRTRFQIEFLLRDAKQYTGLTHCQSRKKKALEFSFNTSLTSINVARAFAREYRPGLSVGNVKTLIHNAMMIQRIYRMSGNLPNKLFNNHNFKDLLFYGVADAA